MTKKIYWDKGHGGIDPGAVGNILLEKTLNHKIVEYGMAYLDANYTEHEQKTSRTDDQTLSLDQRTDDANEWGADLLISCHINSSENKAANGFETFIYSKNPSESTIALQNILHPEVYQVMKAFGINNDRGKKQGNLHMLRESNMDALLSENLFISNEADANRLKQEEFLKAVGEAHARGVAKFLGLPKKVVTKIALQEEVEELLKPGDKGEAVKVMNYQLASLGYISWKDRESNTFGNSSLEALKKFQKEQRIKETGVYDSTTALQFAKILAIYYDRLKKNKLL